MTKFLYGELIVWRRIFVQATTFIACPFHLGSYLRFCVYFESLTRPPWLKRVESKFGKCIEAEF